MEQMRQNEAGALTAQAIPQKDVEQACFHALGLIGRNCEYLDQHLAHVGADQQTRQAVNDISAAAARLDRTVNEVMSLLDFLRTEEDPRLYPLDLCQLLQQVAAQADRQVVQPPLFAVDGHEVGQRLRGVVVSAVARVDDRDLRVHGRDQRRALLGMAHGDDVAVTADGADGVGHTLALGGGGAVGGGEAQHLPAQTQHGALEAETSAGGGLEEQGGGDFAFQ